MVMLSVLLALAAVLMAPAIGTCQATPSVTIGNGTVNGINDATNNVQRFLGIPYAQPPVGNLRLRQAVPLNSSFGTLDATAFGASCYGTWVQPNASEDCLTLNVWRPSGIESSRASLPVLVWLYGGGLIGGYTSDPRSEGTNMVRISNEINKPIILVSLNYRLGSLGFLNGRQMAELGLLNLGMLDQRLAFRWIQENIGAFGGDPKKVTLFGESAGAVSIYSHMMAYGGRDDGLFRGAIMESGGAFPLTLPNTTAFQTTFDTLITNTACSSLANASSTEQLECIRTLPIDVFRASVGANTGQSIDGDFTRTSVQFAFPAGEYIKVPTIIGVNTDEGTTSAPTGINTTAQLFGPLVAGYFRPQPLPNDIVSTLISLYPTAPELGCPYNTGNVKISSGTLDKQACSIFGDLVQVGPARMIATALTNDGVPTYRYRFNHLSSNVSTIARGISTSAEVIYVFSNLIPNVPWDQALAYQMTSAWVSFTHDLDPNLGTNSSLPHWPNYGTNSNSIVFSGYGSSIEQDTYRAEGIQYIISKVLPNGAS